MEATTFAPTVLIDGATVTPEGWMWVLGFAIGGCEWAIQRCASPDFDLDGKVRDYQRRRNNYVDQQEVDRLEKQIVAVQARMRERGE